MSSITWHCMELGAAFLLTALWPPTNSLLILHKTSITTGSGFLSDWLSSGAAFTEAKSGINDPRLNQRRQFCPYFQFVWTKWSRWRKPSRLVIPANSVRLSSLLKIVYEFHKFPVKNPGLLDLDHFILIISSLWKPPLENNIPPLENNTYGTVRMSSSSFYRRDFISYWRNCHRLNIRILKSGATSRWRLIS